MTLYFSLLLQLLIISNPRLGTKANKPYTDGEYLFTLTYDEWNGVVSGDEMKLKITGDYVVVTYTGNGNLDAEIDEVLLEGTLRLHKSGQWIISNSASDIDLEEIGGCVDGPTPIDFEKKLIHFC